MSATSDPTDVYLEIGAKRTFAGALDWPGWCRSGGDEAAELRRFQAILQALSSASSGDTPKQGPRGGVRWTPRRFVKRVAWHVLDHAWEIEDRIR
jgi:hypothetical protein